MALPSASPVNRTLTWSPALLGLVGVALLTFLAGCSSSTSTDVPNQADAKIVEVSIREDASQYVWDDADISGQVDVVDKFGKVTTLATGRRLVLSDGATVRLAGSGLQGVTEAQVWLFSTPRLLNKIPVSTDGSFSSQIIVPNDLEPGQHTVLISATLADGRVVAVNIPAFVPAANTPLDSTSTTENSNPSTTVTLAPTTTTPPTSTSLKKPISTSTTAPRPLPSTAKQTTTTIARPRTTTTTIANNRVSPATTAAPTTVPQSSVATTVPLTTSTTTATTVPLTTSTTTATTVPAATTTTSTVPLTTSTTTATTVPSTTTSTTTTTVPATTTTTSTTTTSTTSTTTTTLPPVTYGVTYSGNTSTGGAIPTDGTSYTSGGIVTVSGNTGSLVKVGFVFNGWCTTQPAAGAACGGTAQAASSTFTISSNTTLYAVWTPATQTISYAAGTSGTGTGPSSPTTALYGSTFTTPANTFTRPGHTFAGWTDNINTYAAGVTYPASGAVVTSNVTLRATWTANTYSITYYDSNSGSGNSGDGGTAPAIQTGSGVDSVTLTANTLVLDGYGFYGWTTTDGSTTVVYNNAQAVPITANTTLNLYPVWGVRTFGTQVGVGSNSVTYKAAQHIDGRVVVVGAFASWNGASSVNRVARLNADGTRDTAFNATLGSGPTLTQDHVLVQPDNKIIVTGALSSWSGSSSTYRIVRLNEDGSLDSNFIANIGTGPTNASVSTGAQIFNLVRQSDGKLLLVGSFTSWNGLEAGGIVRLNTDGSLDETFRANIGNGAANHVGAIGLQSDGKIILAGSFVTWRGETVNRIIRLNTDGTRDTTFTTGTGLNKPVYGLAMQSDNKIVIVGEFTTYNGATTNRVLRLNSDGTLDTAFSSNILAGPDTLATRISIQSDGKLLVSGQFGTWKTATVGSLVRLNSNGTIDAGFSSAIGSALSSSAVNSILVQSDQKLIVLGGFTSWNGTPVGRIVRLNADGTID